MREIDGVAELKHDLPQLVEILARTARWVHPEIFKLLPVWHPEHCRRSPLYDATWTRRSTNSGKDKFEANVLAGKALRAALGLSKPKNFTTCHIWGFDDPKFSKRGGITYDAKFYSCTANLILVPSPLKALTDCVPEIQGMLRSCAYFLYGFIPDHENVSVDFKNQMRKGEVHELYPQRWPRSGDKLLPPNTAEYSDSIVQRIEKRKEQLRANLENPGEHYPTDQVRSVLKYWKSKTGFDLYG
jgi:hypothetical protein